MLCLVPWSEHSCGTIAGNYACSWYEPANEQGFIYSVLDIIILCIEEESHFLEFDPKGSLLLHANQICLVT
jgi:hypothetical protein